ncbi:hypothetical protein [Mycobacterium sp.]|uniref:hypothetical protein n=1 Tax=Mycobacterium sp. TaxID=1785 RepID=UPI003BADB2FD
MRRQEDALARVLARAQELLAAYGLDAAEPESELAKLVHDFQHASSVGVVVCLPLGQAIKAADEDARRRRRAAVAAELDRRRAAILDPQRPKRPLAGFFGD